MQTGNDYKEAVSQSTRNQRLLIWIPKLKQAGVCGQVHSIYIYCIYTVDEQVNGAFTQRTYCEPATF